jgi:peptidoglycan/xylan/chitin deacetylase (PgdA/CDA1 family)
VFQKAIKEEGLQRLQRANTSTPVLLGKLPSVEKLRIPSRTAQPLYEKGLTVLSIIISALGYLLLPSCVTIGSGPGFFRSEDYIVYRIKRGDTPAKLAKKFLGDEKKFWVVEDANSGVPFKKGHVAVIPLKKENACGLRANGFQMVPILCYHRFSDDVDSPLSMPPHVFDRQMKFLKENNYRVVSSTDLLGFLQNEHCLPKKAVVIAIDDGYRSVYNIAYPILQKYGFTATLFLYTDFVGASRNAVTWDQLREMKKSGFQIGGHTMSHDDLTKQRDGEDRRSYLARIEKELGVSKSIIDRKLGQNTILLAFPYGRYDSTVLRVAERTGYEMAVTVNRGSNPFFEDVLALKRSQILRRDMDSFVSNLKTFHRISSR